MADDVGFVGYLNTEKLFIEEMYNETKNPNGIGRLKLCVNTDHTGLSDLPFSSNYKSQADLYNEIFTSEYGYGNTKTHYHSTGTGSISKVIKFIINDDIQFGGGVEWKQSIDRLMDLKDLGEGIKESIFGRFGSVGKAAAGALGRVLGAGLGAAKFGLGLAGMKFQTLMQTVKFWEGSPDPNISLKFNLLATRPDQDIRWELLALYACIYPASVNDAAQNAPSDGEGFITTILTNIVNLSGFMAAPLGYNPVDAYKSSLYPTTQEGSGLIDLRIGKWFHMPNLVAKGFSATISKVTTRYGFPLYAECNIELTPCRMMTITDIYDSFFSTATSDETSSGIGTTGVKDYNTEGYADEGLITKYGKMP